MCRINYICIILFSTLLSLGCSSKSILSEEMQFAMDIADDATPAVLEAITGLPEQPRRHISFEKATYHFYPDKGLQSFERISNHDDVLVTTAFPLQGIKDLVIDGRGSTFIFHGRMIPFLIEHSERIEIKNLTIDWDETFHSEAEVIARDKTRKTFDLRISEKYPYEIRNGQLFFIKEYYEHTIGQSILFDPLRKAVAFETSRYTPLTSFSKVKWSYNLDRVRYRYQKDNNEPPLKWLGRQRKLEARQIEPGVVRIYNHTRELPPVGMILVGKGDQSMNRIAPAFRLTHTKDFKATNVNVHHAGGMGIIAENSENLLLDNFNVSASNDRMISTTADATHFVGCRGKVTLRNCTFNNMLDDAMNVHGTYQQVADILDEHSLGIRVGHYQQLGFTIGREGDRIGFVRLEDSFLPFDQVTLENIQVINGRYQLLTFKEKLPSNIRTGDLIENLDAYPEVVVENCDIGNNRARGLLISTPKKTLVQNNTFHTEMEAILLPVESSSWFESGSVRDLTIRNNTFRDCVHGGKDRGVIRFHTDEENEHIAFQNITIEKNQFNQYSNLILEVSNTQNLRFTDNKIGYTNTFPRRFPWNPVVSITSSKRLKFSGNTYGGKAEKIFESDSDPPPDF